MRYDSHHKAVTRERVLREAAAALRAGGPNEVGIVSVMSRAGLTHGGFYAHFASRDELLASAVHYMFERPTAAFVADAGSPDPRIGLRRLVDRYLSLEHRDSLETGCPIPILASYFHRMPPEARELFVAATNRMIAGIETLLSRAGVSDGPSKARSAFAEMVGAITLARAQPDVAAAQLLLEFTRRSLEAKWELPARQSRSADGRRLERQDGGVKKEPGPSSPTSE